MNWPVLIGLVVIFGLTAWIDNRQIVEIRPYTQSRRPSLGNMKQYKLTAWPDLTPRFQSTAMRRVVSELSQRFVSVRDLARSSGAAGRDIEELVAKLDKDGMLMTRATPQSVNQAGAWRQWWPVAAVRGMVREWR